MKRTFTKTEDTNDFQIAHEGPGAAVLTVLAFLGRHERTWQGETKIQELLGLTWEQAEPGTDGRSLSVTEVQTASLHPKSKFYSRILALTGGREPPAGFQLDGLLGRGAVVTVAHVEKGDRTYANVIAVGPLPRGMAAPIPSVTPTFYDIDEHDPAAYDALPARFKKLVETAESADYRPAPPAPPRPAPPPAAAWQGSHQAQAPAAWSPPGPHAARPPAPPAGGPDFDDPIPF
ncbi:MAG: hypothetical protein IT487_04055 [Chromatiaceae bacterium]|nr:hypothetical protein [Chromatiaceae bacterium]